MTTGSTWRTAEPFMSILLQGPTQPARQGTLLGRAETIGRLRISGRQSQHSTQKAANLSQLCPDNWVPARPVGSRTSRAHNLAAPESSETGTEWDAQGTSGILSTSLIMLRSLVRFQLAPRENAQVGGPQLWPTFPKTRDLQEPVLISRDSSTFCPLCSLRVPKEGLTNDGSVAGRGGARNGGTIPDMDEPPQLQYNGHWRMAVWALRVGYVGLAVAIAGLIVMSLGSTPWVLAVGVIIWLAASAVTLAGFFRSRHELSEPRPGYQSMRFMLIHDTVHARSSTQRS